MLPLCLHLLQKNVFLESTEPSPPWIHCGIIKYSYHLQDGGIAANDERQTAETFDAMCNSYWKLLVQVFATALRSAKHIRVREDCQSVNTQLMALDNTYQNMVAIRRFPRIQQGGQCQTHRGLGRNRQFLTEIKSHLICRALWNRFFAQQLKNIKTRPQICMIINLLPIQTIIFCSAKEMWFLWSQNLRGGKYISCKNTNNWNALLFASIPLNTPVSVWIFFPPSGW